MSRAPLAPSGDDVAVERCMDCGTKPARALPDLRVLETVRNTHPLFYERVCDAKQRIKDGEERAAIMALHGGCVFREAVAAILRSAGRGA